MFEKGIKKGTVRFFITPGKSVKQVQLAGDFSGWKAVPMRKQQSGEFAVIVPLAPGTYEYKFLVDGQWRSDSDNHCWAPNCYGSMNSVATIQ